MASAPSILVCDSDRLFADVLAACLRASGWPTVWVASTLPPALATVTTETVDICLLDLGFPDQVNGTDATRVVLASSPLTKVVVLTSASDPNVLAIAMAQGAHRARVQGRGR